MEISYKSDIGCTRQQNEDRVLCVTFSISSGSSLLDSGLFAVADGMGGHKAGEIASDLAIKTVLSECFDNLISLSNFNTGIHINDVKAMLKNATDKAHAAVLLEAGNKALQGMGTTITIALVIGQDLYVAHVGDSRCYIINEKETIQVTRDHSVVQEMVDAGLITVDEARIHPIRNEITQALGCTPDISIDIRRIKLFDEDIILLCSDGLYNELTSSEMARIIVHSSNIKLACDALIEQAKTRGGSDNISVVLVRPELLATWDSLVSAQTQIDPQEINHENVQMVYPVTKISKNS